MKNRLIILLLFFATSFFAQDVNLAELEKIQFSGNDFFSDAELLDVVALKETPWGLWQSINSVIGIGEKAVYFDSLSLNDEILRLKSFYFNYGFFNTTVKSKYSIDTTENKARVQFLISEGNSSKYKNLEILGLDSLNKLEKWNIKEFSETDTTETYSYENVSIINGNIANYLKDNGYIFADVDSTLIYIDTTSNSVDTKIYFHLGKKYNISDIKIEMSGDGKDEVEEELISEIVGIESGETYSKYNIELGQSRLYKTKLFNIAVITSTIEDTVGIKVPLKISTEIGKLYQATPEVIMNNEDNRFNLGLGLGFSKRNFLGDARSLTLNASIAAQNIFDFIQNMSVTNTDVIGYADLRLILGQPFLFGESIDTRYEVYSTIQKRENEYNTIARGFKVGLNFELPQYVYLTSFGTSWNVENLQVLYQEDYLETIFNKVLSQDPDFDPAEVDSAAAALAKNISKSTNSLNTLFSFRFGANKTNDFVFPTKGYKTGILIANANLSQYLSSQILNYNLNSPLYYKVQVDFSLFPSIYYSKEDAFGIKFRAGNIYVYEGLETSVPYNQRFTSGGSNSVRGSQSRELVPEFNVVDLDINTISPSDLEAIFLDQATPGGLFQFEGTIETRNRLVGNVGVALFVDYGNTWSNAKAFRFDEIAVSAGFGFRYYTDFIPFRIDFAVKLYDPNSTVSIGNRSFWNDLFQIHFAIGEAF
ncbi:MAG: BamA/TamA family outer membrane protein [Melioribacteraceae bacterium]|jgi:outer membrane protein insertion porin family|nr:BamA/TamA family outer membrane protein [Melioribacteraceae bacterium]